ncbi:MAG: hypothetical protein IJ198_12205, partial [Lachnospiraceae bacterium]|nr:hypothetical protein [Lachnospiraceae bacterium]
ATDTTFTIAADGTVTASGTVTEDGVILVEDSKTKVKVSKTDIADGKEIAGATIQILDSKGKEVAKWVSGTEAHEIEGLKTGETYTLREIVAPEGYTIATDTTFTIAADGTVTASGTVTEDGVILVEDSKTQVKVSKTDIVSGEELEGATIQIVLKEGIFGEETVVKTWTSGKEAYVVEGLKTGVTYILRETVAPDGYTVTTDTTFTIDETGKVTSTGTISDDGVLLVEDTKTKVRVSKTDIVSGKELEGATIQILDSNGQEVTNWVSGKEVHEIEGLKTGEEYTLKETVAPEGYTIATATTFTIDESGKVTTTGSTTTDKDGNTVLLVEDAKTKVKVSKTDIANGKELEGATIQILDSDGQEVDKWESTKNVHEIEGLKTGEEYTLRETVAPNGYTIATDTTFTIDETGKVTTTGSISEDGVLLVEDSITRVSVSKTDIANGKEIAGAHIQIIRKGEDGSEEIFTEWDSTEEAHIVEGLTTGVEYTLRETVAPDGYTIAAETTFTLNNKGEVEASTTKISDGVLLVEDAKTKVSISKVDIADGKELKGAHIQIINSKGKVVDEWDSTTEVHMIEGLKTGETYTLKETVAPDGYTVTTDTTFTIDEKGKVTSTATMTEDGVILVEDTKTKVSVSKVDIADSEELEGAHIQILDSEGKVVEEWDSTKEAHVIEGLKTGEEYTLRETVAPDGYTVTTDTTFTIDEKGKVTSTASMTEDGVILVEDAKTKVSVSKVDIADGEELEGAHIQILDSEGKVVEEWDSTKEAHVIEGLKTGVEYTLRETVAPEGHILTTDTTFTIDENGKVTSTASMTEDGVILVEDAKTQVSVSKTDIANGEEVAGAKIQILDKDGKVVEEWTSTTEAHKIEGLLTGVEYTLRETVAPDGYAVATDTTFTIDENGTVTTTGSVSEDGVLLVEDAKTVVKVSKVDIAGGKELEGAHIQIIVKGLFGIEKVIEEWDSTTEVHEIIGLKTGVEYILRETVAPDGYAVATDTKFTLDAAGKVTSTGTVSEDGVLLVEDAMTVVKVSKVDIADGKELEGAKIQILDSEGNVIEEWVSGKEPHEIIGLKTGETYTLRETVAPEGYEIATDTTFTIDKYGKVTTDGSITEDGILLVEDAKKGGPSDKTTRKKSKDSTNTGDDANAMLWLMLGLGAAGALVYESRRRRRAN